MKINWKEIAAYAGIVALFVIAAAVYFMPSLQGKVISGIVAHAQRCGVPVAVICGKAELDEQQLREFGLLHVLETGRGQTLEHAIAHAEENYLRAARELFASLS